MSRAFFRQMVQDRCSIIDTPHRRGHPSSVKNGFAQSSFAITRVPDDCEIAGVVDLDILHEMTGPFCGPPPARARPTGPAREPNWRKLDRVASDVGRWFDASLRFSSRPHRGPSSSSLRSAAVRSAAWGGSHSGPMGDLDIMRRFLAGGEGKMCSLEWVAKPESPRHEPVGPPPLSPQLGWPPRSLAHASVSAGEDDLNPVICFEDRGWVPLRRPSRLHRPGGECWAWQGTRPGLVAGASAQLGAHPGQW